MTAQAKSGRWYPWIFVAAFAVVVTVNGVMAYLAVSTFPGLETEDAYLRGVSYNQTLAAVEQQKQLGWTAEFAFDPSGSLTFRLRDADNRPLDGLVIHGQLLNPTREGQDQDLTLTAMGDGLYQTALTPSGPGQWQVNLYARRGDDVFYHTERIHYRP